MTNTEVKTESTNVEKSDVLEVAQRFKLSEFLGDSVSMENIQSLLMGTVLPWVGKFVVALLMLWIGFKLIKKLGVFVDKMLEKSGVDISLAKFLVSLATNAAKVILVVTLLPMLIGVKATALGSIMGAATLALGFALQGSLANFAGGVMILLFKPYQIGHYIAAGGMEGKVREIQIFNTILTTPDHKTIIIPNGELSNNTIVNYSKAGNRRLEVVFGIGYDDNIDDARRIIEEVASKNDKVLKKPEPADVEVINLGESSVDLEFQGWVKSSDYLKVKFYMLEEVKKAFDKNNISIPFPQRDIHVYNK